MSRVAYYKTRRDTFLEEPEERPRDTKIFRKTEEQRKLDKKKLLEAGNQVDKPTIKKG